MGSMQVAALLLVLIRAGAAALCNPAEAVTRCRLQLPSPVTRQSLCPLYQSNVACLVSALAACDGETRQLFSDTRQQRYDSCCRDNADCVLIPPGPQSGVFCRSSPCFAGGSCFDDEDQRTGSCQCPMDWNGPFCEMDQRPRACVLVGQPCSNGGTCVATSDQDYFCRCTHDHVGVNCEYPLKPELTPTSVCFPADALVTLEDGASLPMHALRAGQRVRTLTASGAMLVSPVLTFLDRKEGSFLFTRLHTRTGHLDVSPRHLVAIADGERPRFVQAQQVSPGCSLVAHNGSSLLVVHVSQRRAEGAFAPLSQEGTLLVQGVLCSCYAQVTSHWLADLVMAPVKLWARLVGDSHRQGVHPYAQGLAHVASLLL